MAGLGLRVTLGLGGTTGCVLSSSRGSMPNRAASRSLRIGPHAVLPASTSYRCEGLYRTSAASCGIVKSALRRRQCRVVHWVYLPVRGGAIPDRLRWIPMECNSPPTAALRCVPGCAQMVVGTAGARRLAWTRLSSGSGYANAPSTWG